MVLRTPRPVLSSSLRGFVALSVLVALGVLAAFFAGCSREREGEVVDRPDGGRIIRRDGGPVAVPVDACPTSNPYCRDERPATVAPSCGNQPVALAPVGVNVMIAVDGASSMQTHWPRIKSAVKGLREAHPDSAFGIQLFWGLLQEDFAEVTAKANWCGQTQNRVLEVGDNSAAKLVEFLGDDPPGPAYAGGQWETSPVIEPLNYYLTHGSKLADPTRTNYLLFIANGNDNCFGSMFTNKADKLLAYEKLAVELVKRDIRVIPIGFDAASRADGAGRIPGGTPGTTDADVLSTLLTHGGSGLTQVPKADDPSKLADVITQVGQTVRNCRFSIPATLDPTQAVNAFELGFTVNGAEVKRDRRGLEGWNFVDGDTSQVELYGMACQAVRTNAPVVASKTCAEDVCGTASIKVETKPRAVLFLFDVSASRIECADGTFNCLQQPGSAGRGDSLTYWETAEHALGESLVAPINDDVEFGLQFFPGKASGALSCEVESTPEVPPAQGTEITILSQMLEKLPFGQSPVVQVLENVASAPGRLADPSVQGSVVMLSDGGDNCEGAPQARLVERLSTAAAKLLKAGVRTHVVRYGSPGGNTPAQEAQLRAIVENGGTATVDPSDPSAKPYVDAKDDAALTAALAQISNSLASCSFALDGLADDVDKENVNLYLNGDVVPFDHADGKVEGWGWADPSQTSVQLYGKSCHDFENNRKTSVIVELGCAPVLVI